MLSPTPAVRAAILGLVVVTVIAVAGAALHLRGVEAHAADALAESLRSEVRAVATALPRSGPRVGLATFEGGERPSSGSKSVHKSGGR